MKSSLFVGHDAVQKEGCVVFRIVFILANKRLVRRIYLSLIFEDILSAKKPDVEVFDYFQLTLKDTYHHVRRTAVHVLTQGSDLSVNLLKLLL